MEISELRKGLELLQCPKCLKPLRYVNNQLVPGEREPVSPTEIQQKDAEYRQKLNQISTIRSGIHLQNQIQTLRSQLNSINIIELEEYMKNPKNISQHNNLISRLMRIQIILEPQYTSSYLRTILKYNQTVAQKQQIINNKDQLIIQNTELIVQFNTVQIPEVPSNDIHT